MEKSDLISHEEIADLGYYFLDPSQEERFLQAVNDEFALRVGEAITNSLPLDKLMELVSLPEGQMQDFMKRTVPEFGETVIGIRKGIIEELREERRTVLFGAGSCRTVWEAEAE